MLHNNILTLVLLSLTLLATSVSSAQQPVLFAPGLLSTELGERDVAFSPDGQDVYFTLWTGRFGTIVRSSLDDGSWGQPVTASFSGHHNDLEAFVTPDGVRLYFASNRPLPDESEAGDFNLWFVEAEEDGWGAAQPVPGVNTDGNEFYPSLDREGNLYWTASYEDSNGGEDIYFATPSDSGFSAPINVGAGVNTDRDEFNALIAPDGSWLAFGSFGRDDGFGGGDLYVSFRLADGAFGEGINMGARINSGALDFCPGLSPDGTTFYFTSRRSELSVPSDVQRSYEAITSALRSPENGAGDIYSISVSAVLGLRPDSD